MVITTETNGFRHDIVTTLGNCFRSIVTTQDIDFRIVVVITTGGD